MIRRLFWLVLICLLAAPMSVPLQVRAQNLPSGGPLQSIQDLTGGGLTPGLTYITYSGYDFEPNTSLLEYNSLDTGRYATVLDGTTAFSLRLDLPQGAQVYEVMFLYRDNSAQSLDFYVTSYAPAGPSRIDLFSGNTAGVAPSTNLLGYSFLDPGGAALFSVDNVTTEYRLRARMNENTTNQIIYGARVGYKPAAGPFLSDRYKTYSSHSFNSPSSGLKFHNNATGVYCTQLLNTIGLGALMDLPNGAKVLGIRFYLIDNSATNINVSVGLGNPTESGYLYPVTGNTSGLTNSPILQSLYYTGNPLFTVDNALNAYRLKVEMTEASANQQIIGAQVHYTLDHEARGSQVKTYVSQEFSLYSSAIPFSQSGTGLYAQAVPGPLGFTLPTNLPMGARVNLARFFVVDNSSGMLQLGVQIHAPEIRTWIMPVVSNTGNLLPSQAVQFKDVAVVGNTFTANSIYSYRIYMNPAEAGTNQMLKGVRLYYTLPTVYIPMLVK